MTREFERLLFKPTREFIKPYRSVDYLHSEQDLRLRSFSSSMGQLTESVAQDILCNNVSIPDSHQEEIKSFYISVRDPLKSAVKNLPQTKKTFTHEMLYPTYFKAFREEKWRDNFYVLISATDHYFGTNFITKLNELKTNTKQDMDVSELRYVVDATLMSWHLFFDEHNRNTVSALGNLVPDVKINGTQIDGLFVDPLFDTSEFNTNGKNTPDNLTNLIRMSPNGYSGSVPKLIDSSILEIKSQFLARDVASRPQRLTPRSWHVSQVINSMYETLNGEGIGIVPKHIVLLYIGSLQPNVVHVLSPNSLYWGGLIMKTDMAIGEIQRNNSEGKMTEELIAKLERFKVLLQINYQERKLEEEKTMATRETQINDLSIGKQKKLRSFAPENNNWGKLPDKVKTKSEKKKSNTGVDDNQITF